MIEATRQIESPRADVWALVSEPYHLADWWPGYSGAHPDRLGLAPNARWRVTRSRAPGLLRSPGGEGLIVIKVVDPGLELAWYDTQQKFDAGISLRNSPDGGTAARAWVDGTWWRLALEGARDLPRQALARLHALSQTADTL